MTTNPLLTELSQLSPGAQQALVQAHGAMGGPGAAARPVDPGVGSAPRISAPASEPPPPMANLSGMGAPQMPSLQAPSMPSATKAPPPNVPRGTTGGDEAERTRLISSGSGESQIHNPVLRGLAGVGNAIGSIAAPGLMAQIPGTEEHHEQLLGRVNKNLTADLGNSQKEATIGETQARIPNINASTSHENAETPEVAPNAASTRNLQGAQAAKDEEETNNPSLATAYAHAVTQAIKEGRDPGQDPIVQHLSDAIVGLQPKQNLPPEAPKTTDIKDPKTGKVHTMGFDAKTGKYDVDEGESGFKPAVTNVNAGDAALDREATRLGKPYEKGISDANSQLEKIADARTMINGSAEAQALGIPKVLTALVSGQGSGVRITQPELNAIGTARGLTGDIQGTLNSWAGKGKLTPAQQKQLTGILDDVQKRIQQKQAIHNDALDKINGAGTREQVISADKEARQRLNDLEKGGGSQHKVGDQVKLGNQTVTIKKINPDGTFDY